MTSNTTADEKASTSSLARAVPASLNTFAQRRQVLFTVAGAAALLAAKQWLPQAMAQTAGSQAPAAAAPSPEVSAFLDFSRKLTGHSELSDVTARRILEAAQKVSAEFASHVQDLVKLTDKAADSQALLAAAELSGIKNHALSINEVWYTGTVVGPKASQVVAYQEALMYATVKDGLPVPTYCFNGPMWWTLKPPAV